MDIKLFDYQLEAIDRMHTGSILCGGYGSGKSLTALGYYYLQNGGSEHSISTGSSHKRMVNPKDLYIITTARKRDDLEWDGELSKFVLSKNPDVNFYKNKVVIDSWNNIAKYRSIKGSFFIFDEQRVVGYGAWTKSFLEITRNNDWILLSATPGDTWLDYMPVFIANGFYRNKTDFIAQHVIYDYQVKFPKVDRYVNVERLIRLRDRILVPMNFNRKTVSHHEYIYTGYDRTKYKELGKTRWNPILNRPIETPGELCLLWRRVVNSDKSKQEALLDIFADKKRIIVFYNFDYELDILKSLPYSCDDEYPEVAEWNGHKHQPIPDSKYWVYLVQYNAGCEGWNCVKTDTIVFFSQSYSYKIMTQAAGRIDRLNTPFTNLYYYYLITTSPIDRAINTALKEKRNFNEYIFIKRKGGF